jgi:hypothetical protein
VNGGKTARMADDLTPRERQIVLMALWNHKLATVHLRASIEAPAPEELSQGMELASEIDQVAARLGGDRFAPGYGLWSS